MIYRLLSEREMFQTKLEEKSKTHVLFSIIFFSENNALYEKMWKNM